MADSPLGRPALTRTRIGSEQRRTRFAPWSAVAFLGLCPVLEAQAARSCDDWSAVLTAVEGIVEVRLEAGPEWRSVASGHRICTGDSVRVAGASRATLTLPDYSTFRLAEHTTLLLPEPPSGDGSLVELLRGLIHVISRDPRRLSFRTPYANAGLEGTEFDIRVDEDRQQTEVTVLEGQVSLTTQPATELKVGSGHFAVARLGEPPTATPLATPIDVMRWASYYPPIITGELPLADQAPAPNEPNVAEFLTRRAAARLRTARLEAAHEDLAAALRLEPAHASALALEAMIALARFDLATARQRSAAATAGDASSSVALIAASHVAQAANELRTAAQTIERALALEPDNAIAVTRQAELALARGDALASIEHATRAAALSPSAATPLVVLGFAELRTRDHLAAQTAFERAAALEPEAPLPRLGLASTATQRGDHLEARRQLELAVVNDPANALSRSYMAKQYETEHRNDLTTSQLDLAKEFDPSDPTPWLYSALQQLRANRAIEALQDLRAAAARNGDRTVFRSRFLLDEDLATQSSALARVHTELGFGRLALVGAWQALADDPDNYAGHRLLADLYASESRQEVARVSSLRTAQLLQPLNVTPVKPQLAQPTSFLAQRAGPSAASFDEFTSPVASNGLKLLASSVGGSNGTRGTEVAVAGLADRIGYGAGYYDFETDGFRANNDFEQRIANGFAQFEPSYGLNLQAELRAVRSEYGDVATYFDRSVFFPEARTTEDSNSLSLGARRSLSASDTLLASVIYQEATTDYADGPYHFHLDRHGYSIDVQHLRTSEHVRLQSGIVYADQDDLRTITAPVPDNPFDPFTTFSLDVFTEDIPQRQIGLYSYAHLSPVPTLTLTIGASIDRIDDPIADEDGVNPKLGLIWRPTTRTTVRATALRALFGSLTTSPQNPQPRLEPVQVAGFAQLVSVGTADLADVRGLAIDHELSDRMFVGWEVSTRHTARPLLSNSPLDPVHDVNLSERVQQGYFYWTPSDRFSVSTSLERGRYGSEPDMMFRFAHMSIDRLPIELRYFGAKGFTVGGRASAVHQSGWFEVPPTPFNPPTTVYESEHFWTVDAFLAYRLPKRRGSLSLNADNLLDERFQFQDVDPANPSLFPERLISLRFTLAFD